MDSSMSGMGGTGMDMSSDFMFRTYNQVLAQGYWYIFAGVLVMFILIRAMEHYQTWSRLRLASTKSIKYPTRITNIWMKIYATATAICRETCYPQLHLTGWWSWLNPPPVGRVLFLCSYWAVVSILMTSSAVKYDAYYWERIGFRNAWISVTQVPLVYLLASKSSLIGWVIGNSHEKLNWLHRLVSRTLLVTVTVHGGFFLAEWVRADFVQLELSMMPMVKYGLGAWAVLVWTFISSLSPLRRLGYEFFVLQHITAASVFLWLLYVHIPSYASYNVWFAIVIFFLDWVLRGSLLIYNNFRIRLGYPCSDMQRIGYQAEFQAMSKDITVITMKDVRIPWKPGQHLYLWVPRLGLLETHPFTIANTYKTANKHHCNEIQLVIRVQSGFSKRIHQYAMRKQSSSYSSLTAFIGGPYGSPPPWHAYETLILVSASTGASFTLPILESILHSQRLICTQRISFLLIVRQKHHVDFYARRVFNAIADAEALGIELNAEFAVTGRKANDNDGQILTFDDIRDVMLGNRQPYALVRSHSTSSSVSSRYGPSKGDDCYGNSAEQEIVDLSRGVVYSDGRPDIASFVRKPVEATGGETSVAVCGGKSLVAAVRNAVANLSNERAVHKGTGAQGIHLHVEEYCF